MLPVRGGQDCEVRTAFELLGHVEDRPEELGELLVLEERGVLEEPEQEVLMLPKERPDPGKVDGSGVDAVGAALQQPAQRGKVGGGPCPIPSDRIAYPLDAGIAAHQLGEQVDPDRAEERADQHAELVAPLLAGAGLEQPVDHQGHEEDLEWDERDVLDEEDQDVVEILEDDVVEHVDRGRDGDEHRAEED